MEFKKDSEPATHRRMVDIHVLLNNNLIAKHVTTDLAQLTVDGVIGQIGVSALSLVEEPTTPEQGYVIIQLQPMEVPIALVMHLKWEDVTKIHAQLMEGGVNGVLGQSVLSAVEEELKVELEFAITQFLNLVVTTVLLMGLLTWKLKHVMKTLVQLMEDGEIGLNGIFVQLLVEELIREEHELVTILRRNLGVMIAQ